MSNASTFFIYDGISVKSVQKPQFCAEWTISNAQNGLDHKMLFHGGSFLCSVIEHPSAVSKKSLSSADMTRDICGELHPNHAHKTAHTAVNPPDM